MLKTVNAKSGLLLILSLLLLTGFSTIASATVGILTTGDEPPIEYTNTLYFFIAIFVIITISLILLINRTNDKKKRKKHFKIFAVGIVIALLISSFGLYTGGFFVLWELDEENIAPTATAHGMTITDQWPAQSFRPDCNNIQRISVQLSRGDAPTGAFKFYVALYDDIGGFPGNLLWHFPIFMAQVGTTMNWLNVPVAPTPVVPGQTYFIVIYLMQNLPSGYGYLAWHYSEGNQYAKGMKLWSTTAGTSWSSALTDDFGFRIYGTGASPPKYTVIVNTDPSYCNVALSGHDDQTSAGGRTVFNNVDPGSHTLTVSKEGYNTNFQTITVDSDEEYDVVLVEASGFTLTVTTFPTYCNVAVSGYGSQSSGSAGSCSFSGIAVGSIVTVTTSKADYITDTQSITMDKDKPLHVILVSETVTYTLTVNTDPSWCNVAVSNYGSQSSGSSSSCAFPGIPSGTSVTITTTKADYDTDTRSATMTADLTEPVTLTPSNGNGNGDKFTLNIYVQDSITNVYLENVSVTCNLETLKTNDKGLVTFSVPADTYDVIFSKTGYKAGNKSIAISDTYTAYLTLTPEGAIPGFELLTLIAAFAVAFILFKKRKRIS